MDTNRIKKFAIEARNVLKAGVAAKLMTLGFKKDGSVSEDMKPTLLQGGCIWNGRTETEGFYHRWMSLYERVQRKGLNEVYEEVAYTWFNRCVAIRILRKNGLSEPVLDFVDAANTPRIVDQARSGQIPQMNEEDRLHLIELLDDDTKTTEQFALLMTAWCQNNPIISKCFGSIADYTEILLPNNILTEGGFIDMLNHTEFISDEDFTSPELIGWLYQFYISERKDEVFAKKGKFEADEIPAATQIFTPNWIVKYMVQNTVGRIYLDNNPYSTTLKANWKYLVEGEPTPQDSIYRYEELTDLKVADLACGSGHILNECFDLLYELYIFEGYSRGEAIENIFKYNLTGIDLDRRAQQLSMFALLLKACQKDRSYADARCMPHVLTMPNAWDEEKKGSHARAISAFFQGNETGKMMLEMNEAMKLMKDADSLGSIMKFDISDSTRLALMQAMEYWNKNSFVPETVATILPYIDLILTLTEKYSALVMNPPYMGAGNMNPILSKYVKDNYEEGRQDLCTTFMMMQTQMTVRNGYFANIIPPSWMFLSAFESLRNYLIANQFIVSLLHLSRGVFGADFGSSSCVLRNTHEENCCGIYFRLIKRTFQEFDNDHLRQLFENTLYNHAFKFDFNGYSKEQLDIQYSTQGSKIYYDNVYQGNFKKIPGCPLGYWISNFNLFDKEKISTHGYSSGGRNKTHDNDKYVRYFWEINKHSSRWNKYANAGGIRKYNGIEWYVVDWSNEAREFYNSHGGLLNQKFWNKEGITWNLISSSHAGFSIKKKEFIYSSGSPTIFNANFTYDYRILGFLNSSVARFLLQLFNPTINTTAGDVLALPYVPGYETTEDLVIENINISKQDWDAHETSWDFMENELIRLKTTRGLIEDSFKSYIEEWTRNFNQLHANEEELNRQFIEIYDLQNELTPDVPLDELTILQQGEIKIENNQIQFQKDVVIKQLISYAIGCWVGRYRLDKPGLHIAHPSPTADEVCTYAYGNETLTVDDDGIIPLLPYDCPFDDNLQNRIADFVRIAFGADSLAENLNFIEQSLGCTIEKYLDKDYWKDHKKMYQNRPIYWLWSSKKGAFRVLSYMHRMDAYTAERVRSKYLLPYIEFLQNKISELCNRDASLSTADSRKLDNYRKILEECQEYHERLQVVAEQAIGFDLDDGVVVNYAKFGDVLSKIK